MTPVGKGATSVSRVAGFAPDSAESKLENEKGLSYQTATHHCYITSSRNGYHGSKIEFTNSSWLENPQTKMPCKKY